MLSLADLKKELNRNRNPQKSKVLQRFFKTGKGEYGEGDIFLGITVPQQRKIAKKFTHLKPKDLANLLNCRIHECRLVSLLVLVDKYQKGNNKSKQAIFNFYLHNTKNINNWDLVDLSAPKIIGDYIFNNRNQLAILQKLAKSKNLWERRIAILATFSFIKQSEFKPTLKISKMLLADNHDLIHKAVGWMLREVGKKDEKLLTEFLNKYIKLIPRTMLRYAIERFDEEKRRSFLRR